MPEARPVARRISNAAADMGSLVRMGLADEQPVPAPQYEGLFLEPDIPPPDDEPA